MAKGSKAGRARRSARERRRDEAGAEEAPKPESGKRNQVAIFGAGIAGLTAAHELIERGFRVEVYEKEEVDGVQSRLSGETCAIGGLARTHWARIPSTPGGGSDGSSEKKPVRAIPAPKLVFSRIYFQPDSIEFKDADEEGKVDAIAQALAQLEADLQLEVRGYMACDRRFPSSRFRHDAGSLSPSAGLDYQRAQVVANRLMGITGPDRCILVRGLGMGAADDWTCPDDDRHYVDFHLLQELVPGEHGFRFFPSFYRHLFDTMSRTPIPNERSQIYDETSRTVLDNVLPAEEQAVGRADPSKSFTFTRTPATSLAELFEMERTLCEKLDMSEADIAHHQVKLFKYVTSCSQRREREYEYQSWFDFVEGDKLSAGFREIFDAAGEIAISARARDCDARTYGNISVQLFLNQLENSKRTDGTLNGPTSIAWLNHWRRYLRIQGVEFHRGELKNFIEVDGQAHPIVTLTRTWHRKNEDPEDTNAKNEGEATTQKPANFAVQDVRQGLPLQKEVDTLLLRDYYVVAISIQNIRKIVDRLPPHLVKGDLARIQKMKLGNTAQANPDGMLRHLHGIQYFLATDDSFVRGYSSFVDSPWKLSSISQPQFWQSKRGWWDGYRGVLSVDIANFHNAGRSSGKPAWEASPDEIAEEVWKEICRTFEDQTSLPESYLAYHFQEPHGPDGEDIAPYLVTRPGEYPTRPGRLDPKLGYELPYPNLVLAGSYMQTYTRLTTTEAANESGRHAVNAILHQHGFRGARCRTWNLEEREPKEFAVFKELDRRLMERGLPHFMDILELRQVPTAMLGKKPDMTQLCPSSASIHRP